MIETEALETRLRWLNWAQKNPDNNRMVIPYLEQGETYAMNQPFARLVDDARRKVPDDLVFDPSWLLSKKGFMWIEEPFEVPVGIDGESGRIAAVAWADVSEDAIQMIANSVPPAMNELVKDAAEALPDTLQMIFFERRGAVYSVWSDILLRYGCGGTTMVALIRNAEKLHQEAYGSRYAADRSTDMLHEIRWFYTAMHLMSQKLTATIEHRAERGLRRRMEYDRVQFTPFYRIVTLRRMEEARKADPAGQSVNWQWQFHVRGHWREQWYPSEECHKSKWIEEYVKGPEDRPFKPPQHTIYKAAR